MTPRLLSERHREWQGEDAPEECVVCEKPWPCIDAYLDERERANKLVNAAHRFAKWTDTMKGEEGGAFVHAMRMADEASLDVWRALAAYGVTVYEKPPASAATVVTDVGNVERNHYDWFFPSDAPPGLPEDWLAATEAKMIECLSDPFADDAARVMLVLIAEIRRLRSS